MNDDERIEAAAKAIEKAINPAPSMGGPPSYIYRAAKSALAAVCPPGSVVVSADDLRHAVSALMLKGTDVEACDRLIRVLNGEAS